MSDPILSFPDQPRVDLDRRLGDLVEAANEVLATQGRLRALLRASQAITAQLDLPSVLRSIVESARALTGAEYAALGVIDEHGGLEQFIHSGIDADTVERIGHLPQGRGLLGAVIQEARPIRLEDISSDGRSVGFPEAHPPMTDFLGVPIRTRGVVYGNLYLTNHPNGSFSDEDEQLIRSLAATAGFAIENARLFLETRQRQAWAAASAEVTARLLTPSDSSAVAFIADRVRALAEAESAFVVLTRPDSERLQVLHVEGADSAGQRGSEVPVKGTFAELVLASAEALRFDEQQVRALKIPATDPFGPLMGLPLVTPDRVLGAIIVARAPGGRPFSQSDLAMAADFTGRASVALELHEARSDQERVLIFEERGRIARDLHDRVIQQLFATGMQLQGVLGTLPEGRGAERVDAAVQNLDSSIAQIRRIIFTLSDSAGMRGTTVRHRVLELIGDLGSSLGVEPVVTFTGPVDAVLDDGATEDLLAAVSESVTNAVKHAAASEISVSVLGDSSGTTLVVVNDGAPLVATRRRSGLANLEQRATRRNGWMALSAEGERTVLRWHIPLVHAAAASTA
jgi:signal transduction histidine kinase